MKFFTTILGLVLFHFQGFGQESTIVLQGKILEINLKDSGETILNDVPIEIWSDDSLIATLFSSEKGEYKFSLPFFHHYRVKYGGEGYIRKMVDIDASDFAQQTRYRGYLLDIDILLFPRNNVEGLEFLDTEPIARAYYDKKVNTVVWQADITENINNRIAEKIRELR